MTPKIVVADDHAVVQEGLRALLSAVDGYELVGVASSGPRRFAPQSRCAPTLS